MSAACASSGAASTLSVRDSVWWNATAALSWVDQQFDARIENAQSALDLAVLLLEASANYDFTSSAW
jgi:hypothetical protein